MINKIENIHDVEHLRYDIIRTYDNPEFDNELKEFVVKQLDKIINGSLPLSAFTLMQDRISKGMCGTELNTEGC